LEQKCCYSSTGPSIADVFGDAYSDIKAQILSWFGHLHRMPEERMIKKSIQVETDVKKTTRETKEQMGR
jgi:hypothetical protein